MPNAAGKTVAQLLPEKWVATLGFPAVATTDCGLYFDGAFAKFLQSFTTM